MTKNKISLAKKLFKNAKSKFNKIKVNLTSNKNLTLLKINNTINNINWKR